MLPKHLPEPVLLQAKNQLILVAASSLNYWPIGSVAAYRVVVALVVPRPLGSQQRLRLSCPMASRYPRPQPGDYHDVNDQYDDDDNDTHDPMQLC